MKKIFKKIDYKDILVSILLMIIITLISFIILKETYKTANLGPSGTNTILITDMLNQYVAFYQSLHRIFKEPGLIFYNDQLTMGYDMFSLFAYYLSSPFSFIVLFFPQAQIHDAVFYLMWIKTLLTGITMFIMLKGIFKRNSLWFIPLAVSYSLMSYNIVYSLSTMWLDGVIFLPLVILGIVRLIDNKKAGLFIVSFSITIIANYYTAFMIGIFSILFFAVYLNSKTDIRKFSLYKDIIIKAAISTVIILGVTAFFTIPTILGLSNARQGMEFKSFSVKPYFPFFELFSKLTAGQYTSISTNYTTPSIFVGFFATILAIGFFFNRDISIKKRLSLLFLTGFLILCFAVVNFDIFMHAGRVPNWFPFRYSFVFSFLLILLAGYNLEAFARKHQDIKVGVVSLILLIPLTFELKYNAETMFKGLDTQFRYQKNEVFEKNYNTTHQLLSLIKEDTNFYRLISPNQKTNNDPLLYGYNGIAYYTSSYDSHYNTTLRNLGFSNYWYWIGENGTTPVTESLFAVKHTITNSSVRPAFYKNIGQVNDYTLFENPYSLPLWYSANNSYKNVVINNSNHVGNQNNIINHLSGTDLNIFDEYSRDADVIDSNTFTYSFTATRSGSLYLKYTPFIDGDHSVRVNNVYKTVVSRANIGRNNVVKYLGEYEKDQEINIRIFFAQGVPSNPKAFIHILNHEAYIDAMTNTINTSNATASTKNGIYKGEVNVGEDSFVATSLPYLKGLRVSLNGKRVKTFAYLNSTFLGFDAKPGTYNIKITYVNHSFVAGTIISVTTLALTPLLYFYRRQIKNIFYAALSKIRNK